MEPTDADARVPPRTIQLRSRLARRSTLAVSSASRRLGLGSGSTVGGRVGLAVDPKLLLHLGAGRPIALVSGTNGKTTTTRMLSEAVGTHFPVATSRAGANMTAGLVAALASAPQDAVGVLEVDEAHLPATIAALAPSVILLLNLSRDQLDRVSEVRLLAERWRAALATTDATVIANVDDPLVVFASTSARTVRHVGVGVSWHEDAHHCPRCNARITYFGDGPGGSGWTCTCGFSRPPLDAWVESETIAFADRVSIPLRPALPGRFNVANATMAALAAEVLGIALTEGAAATSRITEVEGRFATTTIAGRPTRLLLAKNPAGFTELLELVREDPAPPVPTSPLVVGINARIADGHDPSWLWDVPFEGLAGRRVVATGERARDLAVRLVHAGVEVVRIDDQRAAIAAAGPAEIDYIGNYTAFQELRRSGGRRGRVSTNPDSSPPAVLRVATGAGQGEGSDSTLRIVLVHPDLLGTYGDSGNGRILVNRAQWRGIDAEIVAATSDEPLPEAGDLYLLGGGEDGPQLASTEALRSGAMARAVERGAVVLAVCAGYQILGNAFPAPDGSLHPGLGLLDVTTERGNPRVVGEILVTAHEGVLTGFENHGGRTARADGVAPLGQVTLGIGNGDGTDGARCGRIFATYLHGPILARNPNFADELLALVVGHPLGPLDDSATDELHRERVARASATKAQRVARGR